jgi:protein-glutamine gamma-glutamyltransferase
MSPSDCPAPLLLLRFFHRSVYLLVAVSFLMIALADQISGLAFWMFAVVYLASSLSRSMSRLHLSSRQARWATWLYTPFFVADVFLISRSFVPATLHLVLFVLSVKLLQPKSNRDYFQIILLSFLLVLAASSLTISLYFLVLLVIFLLICTATLISFEMSRHLNDQRPRRVQFRTCKKKETVSTLVSVTGEVLQWRAAYYIATVSTLSLVFILIFGSLLFFAIPRFGVGYFQRSAGQKLVLSGFSDHIRLGGIGAIQMDPAVIMRVKVRGDLAASQDVKWRGVTMDHFDGQNWSKHVRGKVMEFTSGKDFRLNTTPILGRRVHYQVLLEPASTRYLFTLDRLLWLGGNLCPLRHDPMDDSVTGTSRLSRRLSYQAMSVVPDETSIQTIGTPMPENLRAAYLQLPPLDARIFALAQEITAKAPQAVEKATHIERYLFRNYRYSLDPFLIEQPQPLAAFLLENRRGHCEYFASAMVVLLRAVGIPCRIVNGFRNGEYNDVGGDFIIRGKDAHSWVEAFFPDHGWRSYDPTPAGVASPPRSRLFLTLGNYIDAFELFWGEWILGYDDIIQGSLFRDLQEQSSRWLLHTELRLYRVSEYFQKLLNTQNLASLYRSDRIKNLSILCVGALIIWLALHLFRWLARHLRVRRIKQHGIPGSAIFFYSEMMRILETQGNKKPGHWTPTEFMESLPPGPVKSKARELTQLYNELRFSPSRFEPSQVDHACQILSDLNLLCRRHFPRLL